MSRWADQAWHVEQIGMYRQVASRAHECESASASANGSTIPKFLPPHALQARHATAQGVLVATCRATRSG